MFKKIVSSADVKWEDFFHVYGESTAENARSFYPDMEEKAGLFRAEEEYAAYMRQEFFPIPGAYLGVWEESGGYCSALRLEPYEDGWLLSALETEKSLRRRGYGQMLIEAVQRSLAPGEKIYSHVSRRNKPSQNLHKKLGFVKVRDYAVYLDGTVDGGADTLLYTKN